MLKNVPMNSLRFTTVATWNFAPQPTLRGRTVWYGNDYGKSCQGLCAEFAVLDLTIDVDMASARKPGALFCVHNPAVNLYV